MGFTQNGFATINYATPGQDAETYKAAIDNAVNLSEGLVDHGVCKPQSTPNMTITCGARTVYDPKTGVRTRVATSNHTFTAPTTNPRYDLICINPVTGASSVVAGTEAASPADPTTGAIGLIPVCRVRLTVGMTAITALNLDDLRPASFLLQWPLLGSGTHGAPALAFQAEPSLGFWRPASNTIGVSGNIQIGNLSETVNAAIMSLTDAWLYLYANGGSTRMGWIGLDNGGDMVLQNATVGGAAIRFINAGVERGRFGASGHFMLGTTTPASQFNLYTNFAGTDGLTMRNSGGSIVASLQDSSYATNGTASLLCTSTTLELNSAARDLYFKTGAGGSNRMFIASTGYITTGAVAGANGYTAAGSITMPDTGAIRSKNTAKFWVNFNGTGTVAIRDQFNVSSITDNGVGSYVANLTNAVNNTNGACAGSAVDQVTIGDRQVSAWYASTTTVKIMCGQTASTSLYDAQYVQAVGWGQ